MREGDETDRWGRPVSVSLEEGGDPDEQGPLVSGRVRESAQSARESARGPSWAGSKQAARAAQCTFSFSFCLKMLDV